MSKLPVSVFIIALNEADRIGRAVESVRGWADEVIVIDSGSSDDTVANCEKLGARVLYNAWPGYGQQKRFGEDQCRNNWLLNIDADEAISSGLAEEIQGLFSGGEPPHAACTAEIVEILPGESRPRWMAHRVDAIRLYDKRRGRYHESTVHDRVHMQQGSVGKLKNIIEHRSLRGFTHSVEKINRYSTMQAQDMMARGKPPALFFTRLLIEFPFSFFKSYILRGYIFHGIYGFINATNYAFSRFLRLAKYWELSRKKD